VEGVLDALEGDQLVASFDWSKDVEWCICKDSALPYETVLVEPFNEHLTNVAE
jgi:hypothetical protein